MANQFASGLLRVTAVGIVFLLYSFSSAMAELPSDLQGSWTTDKGNCKDPSLRIIIRPNLVTGADFRCSVGEIVPGIGTGMAGFQATCSFGDGHTKRGLMAFDFSREPVIVMSIPGKSQRSKAEGESWFEVTRC